MRVEVKMKKSKSVDASAKAEITDQPKSLSALLSKKPIVQRATFWIVGDTPLIVHAWSEKAKREMLAKQVKAVKGGREARDPESDFISSLYEMGPEIFGFPVTGITTAILRAWKALCRVFGCVQVSWFC